MPETVTDEMREARRPCAESLLEEYTNSWDGSDSLDKLLNCKWAVVVQRSDDAWVLGADSWVEVAMIESNCLTGTEGYDEWVEGLYDLATGEPIPYTTEVCVTLKGRGGDILARA